MYTNTYPDTGGFLFRKMYWADKLALDLKNRGPQRVDDAKTPSGIIHVGSIRGVIIHDLAFKALVFAGVNMATLPPKPFETIQRASGFDNHSQSSSRDNLQGR